MIFRILGDSDRDFDGKFEAQFIDETEKHLYYDLDDWESMEANGGFNGKGMHIFKPVEMLIDFDTEYELESEAGEKVYEILKHNGWSETKRIF
jgi:hypothetical protein